ncbi:hypothetical protein [Protaetiibacter larvae]|uniref:YncE family protein n=1 Tax=Protaetiibacter larvae TaxID=2592654 RepID=A0A5C1Y6P7_9MICO|nr:hypothetical protein [Protaetiibacter larvae]QEO08999.1 hypothetical protein FLP23_02590 [Protaetiibacter larvae]
MRRTAAALLAVGFGLAAAIGVAGPAMADSEPIATGGWPYRVVVSPDGSRVYATVALVGGGEVAVIDPATSTVLQHAPVGAEPIGLTTDSTGRWIYVANSGSNTISVLDADAGFAVAATIPTDAQPYEVWLSDDATLWVVNRAGASVQRFDVTDPGTPGAAVTIPMDQLPTGITGSPDGAYVFVSRSGGSLMSRISTADNSVVTSAGGLLDQAYTVEMFAGLVYATSWVAHEITVVDPDTLTRVGGFASDVVTRGMAMSPDGSRLYVALDGSASVRIIDPATLAVTPVPDPAPVTFAVRPNPDGVAVNPFTGDVFVGNHQGASVSRAGTPSIVAPVDVTVTDGETATFSTRFHATVDSYRWQVSRNGGASWTDIPGTEVPVYNYDTDPNPSYSLPATLADDGAQFRVVVDAVLFGGEVESDAAVLTVNEVLAPTGADAEELFTSLGVGAVLIAAGVLVRTRARLRRT